MLGIAQRRRLRIDRGGFLADIRGFEDPEAFGVGGHYSVFDAVMDHLDEMAGAVRSAMQITLLSGAASLFAPRRPQDIAAARRERCENRVEMLHGIGLAA